MQKILKKIVSFTIIAILIVSNNVSVKADGLEDLGKVVDGSVLTNNECSEVTLRNVERGNILNQATVRISNNGNGSVNIYGAIFGSVVCDRLTLNMTLQRYSNGSWSNVSFYEDYATNKTSFSKSYNVSVTRGYYYRIKAACVAKRGSTIESKAPISDGLWIG